MKRTLAHLFLAGTITLIALPLLSQQTRVRPAVSAPVQTATPTVGTMAPVAGGGGKVTSDYLIGPDDSLQITVWKEPTLSGTFPVRPDGKISLVLVGEIQAAGLTPAQLTNTIKTGLEKYIKDPIVSVVVAAVNSQHIYVLGEVQHVGEMVMAPGMTPLQAISAAGGLTPYSSGKKMYILRTVNGKQTRIPYDYKKAIHGETVANVTLQPGDTIVVP